MTPKEAQAIILDFWPDATEGAGGFAQVASQASIHKISIIAFKRICGELKITGAARWEVVPKVIGRMRELAKDAPTGGDASRGDRARRMGTMIRQVAAGAPFEGPYDQDVYQRAVSMAEAANREPVWGDLIRARRAIANQPRAPRGERSE